MSSLIVRVFSFAVLLLVVAPASANDLRYSVVSIQMNILEMRGSVIRENKVEGTACFLENGKTLLTATHVVRAMALSDEWSEIELYQHDEKGELVFMREMAVRILYECDIGSDGASVLELAFVIPGVKALRIRPDPLTSEEDLIALGFFGGKAHYYTGHLVTREKDVFGNTTGLCYFELRNKVDFISLGPGSSGGPIIDSCGNIAAIVTISRSMSGAFLDGVRKYKFSYPEGSPTNKGLPLLALRDMRMDSD